MSTVLSHSLFSFSRNGRTLLATLAVAIVVALAAGLGPAAMAQPLDMAPGQHHGMGHGGKHVEHMLEAVNATPEQRAQVKQIMDAAHNDLKAQREAGQALRQQSMALLAQPTIDARAVEAVRQQMLAQHDASSKRMSQALVDAANVLTPTQRKTLAEMMAKRQAMLQRHQAERDALGKSGK
jgi:periplasmic protein CpxP/Spy